MRKLLSVACASVSVSRRGCLGLLISASLGLLVRAVTGKGPRRAEFAEFVADHILADLNGQEFMAVIDAEGQADELRQDRRTARPDLDDLVAAGTTGLVGLGEKVA